MPFYSGLNGRVRETERGPVRHENRFPGFLPRSLLSFLSLGEDKTCLRQRTRETRDDTDGAFLTEMCVSSFLPWELSRIYLFGRERTLLPHPPNFATLKTAATWPSFFC